MKPGHIVVVSAVVVATIVAIVILLATGGSNEPDLPGADAREDVVIGEGPDAPTEVDIADIVSTEVNRGESSLAFEARMAEQLPRDMSVGALVFRWEILEGSTTTWLVTAEIGDGTTASILDQSGGFGASTVDDTFPGSITVSADVVRVELRTSELTGWPESFDWALKTSLDADRRDGASALATDSAPDGGATEHSGD